MLEKLSIENYALIRKLDLELSPSLNIITGETGAGKSILLGALGLILGNRTDTGVLNDAERNCIIEGVFDLDGYGLEAFFGGNDLDYDRHTAIRRIITPAGKSRAYINDTPVQLGTLRELSSRLIDVHSQNHSALAADGQFRMRVIDTLADNSLLRSEYGVLYRALQEREQELARLREGADRDRRDEDYIRFQWEQLSALGLHEGELQVLETEQKELSNAGEILAALAQAVNLMEDDEKGALTALKTASAALQHISPVLDNASVLAGRIRSAYVELKDSAAEISSLAGRIENDPGRLEAVDNRLGSIYALMKRHNAQSSDELIILQNELRMKLDSISSADGDMEIMENEIAGLREAAAAAAAGITESRRSAAARFDAEAEKMLGRLGMHSAGFVTAISPSGSLSPSGGDRVDFLFNANRESGLQPLERIASGGETSRVMLALKSIIARSTMLPTIIFDEIDTGVSGRIADTVGGIIAELGDTMQVINITHLPQVASKGNTHFLVYKEETPAGNETRICRLDDGRRVEEIAKMLSGSKVTDAAVAQARTLLGYE